MPVSLAACLAFLVGLLVIAQARVNGAIAQEAGNGAVVALLTFTVGLCLTLVFAVAVPAQRQAMNRLRDSLRAKQWLRPWHLLGGLGGALFVTAQGASAAVIGVALFTVLVVAGQISTSLFVDRSGLAPTGRTNITPIRFLAGLVAIGGVAVALGGDASSTWSWPLAALAFVAGGGTAVQQAVNARVRIATGSAGIAGFVNFVVGFFALLLVLAIARSLQPIAEVGDWFAWWMPLGGIFGVSFIITGALAVPKLGVLNFMVVVICGQSVAALVATQFWPLGTETVTVWLVAGSALTVVAGAMLAAGATGKFGTERAKRATDTGSGPD